MNQATAFRQRVLHVAAASGRALPVRAHAAVSDLPTPAKDEGSRRVLFVGAVPALDAAAWRHVDEVWVADRDADRRQASVAYLRDCGIGAIQPVRADAFGLKVDWSALEERWRATPPQSPIEAHALLAEAARLAELRPVVPSEWCAVVYCASLNECDDDRQRVAMLEDAFRVLRRGGVARFEVNLTDEPDADAPLLTEHALLSKLAATGFYGLSVVHRTTAPTSVARGIETRAYVVDAFRGKDGPCLDCKQAVIYRGPWAKVFDDDGHVFERGVRTAVCEKTFAIMTSAPYAANMIGVEPYLPVPPSAAPPFACRSAIRRPAETKGLAAADDSEPGACC